MQVDQEVHELKSALTAVEAAIERLGVAWVTVTELLDEADGRVAMPNSRRAEEQLRTALNAATGARKLLERRLELRQGGGLLRSQLRSGAADQGSNQP